MKAYRLENILGLALINSFDDDVSSIAKLKRHKSPILYCPIF